MGRYSTICLLLAFCGAMLSFGCSQHCMVKNNSSRSCRVIKGQPYGEHFSQGRKLYGNNLPDVQSNEVKCYKWKIQECKDGSEICQLIPLNREDIDQGTLQKRRLYSPHYEERGMRNKKYGKRYFCVYNVSLNCPTESVHIRSTDEDYKWPVATANEGCRNYVAFYTNQSKPYPLESHKYCGKGKPFSIILESSSFLAILWTENIGTFGFEAECSGKEDTSSPGEGSTTNPDPEEEERIN